MASIEFFRPESQRPLDTDGFEVDSATREIDEIDAWLHDQAARIEPSAADVEWLNSNPTLPPIAGGAPEPFEPSASDWEEYHLWSLWQDRLEAIYGPHGVTDDDVAAAGMPVG
jgi:hypothetical protein